MYRVNLGSNETTCATVAFAVFLPIVFIKIGKSLFLKQAHLSPSMIELDLFHLHSDRE